MECWCIISLHILHAPCMQLYTSPQKRLAFTIIWIIHQDHPTFSHIFPHFRIEICPLWGEAHWSGPLRKCGWQPTAALAQGHPADPVTSTGEVGKTHGEDSSIKNHRRKWRFFFFRCHVKTHQLWLQEGIPSGNLLHSYWKWPFIVHWPIENGDFQ